MGKVKLSPTVFDNLVKHLVDIEERKGELIKQHFPYPSKERSELESVFDDYIRRVDQIVRNTIKTDAAGNDLPLVTFGSEVEVQDLETRETYRFRIVSPFDTKVGGEDISYLSPMGKALLLKKAGDEITVEAPAGVFRYKILSIRSRY